ncbi:MAG: 6-carboxytetrahydropterin synthase [Dehalococcoidia bacterium]|nr:6-carboxytetrahydropterin synthase [Dehalococcoidia bacterium]
MNYPGEASYLHGHSGLLTLEIEGEPNEHGYSYACKEALKLAWEVADNFHHATVFQEGDPLLELVLAGYEKTGMKGTTDRFGKPAKALKHQLVWSFPESRVAVTKKPSTCENFCEIFYELLKDKLNIKKVTFRSSSLNCATRNY